MLDNPRMFKGSGWTVVPVDISLSDDADTDRDTYWLVETSDVKDLRKLAVEAEP